MFKDLLMVFLRLKNNAYKEKETSNKKRQSDILYFRIITTYPMLIFSHLSYTKICTHAWFIDEVIMFNKASVIFTRPYPLTDYFKKSLKVNSKKILNIYL